MSKRLFLAFLSALIAATTPCAVTAENKGAKPIKLFGQIDELTFLTSSAGVKLSGKSLPAKVDNISLGSSAAYSGMRKGDKVLSANATDNNIVFTIERAGKRYEANVATDVTGLKAEFEHRKIKWSLGDAAFDKEIEKLKESEIVLLLDRSLSMDDHHAGVPGDLSKWSWCKAQIDNFYFSTARFFDTGFDIVTFNDKSQRWKNVSLWDLKQVFSRFKPEGTRKDIATPLREVITDYVRARKPDSKPLIVLVLTDGLKNEGLPLQQILAEASQQMTRPREMTVVFMQIGDSIFANELFDDLDRNLIAKGAKYDIAEFKSFDELRNKGVLWTLLATAKEVQESAAAVPKPAPPARRI
jgi:hypothetical protein